MTLEKIIRKHSLKNAFDYGKANPGGVVGKVIADFPDAKADMKKTMALITKTVSEVNKLGKEKIEKELGNYEFAEKKQEERHFRLKDAEQGNVITRIAPEPSAYPHIGHAKAFFLNEAAAKEYGGRLAYLKFDDTNPEKESQEFVDAFKTDIDWLGIKYEKIVFASDYMTTYYELAEKLIKQKDAYVCSCTQEKISKLRGERKRCKCFENSVEENLIGFKLMQTKAEPESIVLRLVGDMASNNTTLLDPVIFRVIVTPHYRQKTKYRCWPVYDFDSPITDSLLGITHMLRSKEYELRDELYLLVLDKLGMKKPVIYDFSRLVLKGTILSKRKLKPMIDNKLVMGWDDPRMPTVAGLRRRGILQQAIKNFVLSFGLSKVESTPGWEALLFENRKLLEDSADRYNFVKDETKLIVEGNTSKIVELPLHPHLDHGTRKIKVGKEFFLASTDAKQLKKGEIIRLKDAFNVQITSLNPLTGEYAGNELVESKKLQWVSAQIDEFDSVTVLKPSELVDENEEFRTDSLITDTGVCEKSALKLKEGSVIQFTRYGFVRLDDVKNKVFFFSA